jgi:uncharacterized damage-inducible protein DinB
MDEFLREAFRHAAWGTRTLIAACRPLCSEHRARRVCGIGGVVATLNHVVLADAGYAAILGGANPAWAAAGETTDDLDLLETRAAETARVWEGVLAGPLDAKRRLLLDDGTYECPASVVVAQALHHGAAHREQVRAGLAGLGVKPPDLQPWAWADETGLARWLRPRT